MPRFTLEDGQSPRSIDALQLQCHGGQGHPISWVVIITVLTKKQSKCGMHHPEKQTAASSSGCWSNGQVVGQVVDQVFAQVVDQVVQTQRPGWVRFTEVSRHSAPGLTSTRVAHVVLLTTPNPTHSWKAFFLPRSLSGVGLIHAKDYWHLSSMKALYLLFIPWTSKRNMIFNFKFVKVIIFPSIV